jgi:hypothetical protein
MTQRDPDLFKMLIREIGQNRKANVVLGKALRVLPETELLKPIGDLLHRGSARGLAAFTGPLRKFIPNGYSVGVAPIRWPGAGSGPRRRTHQRPRERVLIRVRQAPDHPAMWEAALPHGTSECLKGRTGEPRPHRRGHLPAPLPFSPLKADVCHCVRHVAEVPRPEVRFPLLVDDGPQIPTYNGSCSTFG